MEILIMKVKPTDPKTSRITPVQKKAKNEGFDLPDFNCCVICAFIVKLHSELANPTELQLDGVGVDFVFPPSQLSNNNK